ncbi:MAG: Fe-S protein assembly co-chaperone HscB [Betaproteobacteria bacterium]|nr:Fe-S protein assembly co-chaperone HscB [Betaproteobacteria bacterium]
MSVDLSLDYFSLFGLPCRFRLDETALDRAWHALQTETHPDCHAHLPENAQRAAMQEALRINEAYITLKKSVTRARYLLELAGMSPDAINENVVAPEYLFEQLEWREAVQEAREANDVDTLEQLALRLQIQMAGVVTQLAGQLDEQRDLEAAADTVRRLMFLDKLRLGIDNALAALDD